jgi:hypothetical protein
MTTLTDIDKQIADLQAQKRELIKQEKKTALKKVEAALQELNALGYNYSITESGTPTRTRRSGVRGKVLEVVKNADGIKPSDIAVALGIDNKAGKQSVANALSALKKAGSVVAEEGKYHSL